MRYVIFGAGRGALLSEFYGMCSKTEYKIDFSLFGMTRNPRNFISIKKQICILTFYPFG